MKWQCHRRTRLVLVMVLATMAIHPGPAAADFRLAEAVNLGPVVNSPYNDSDPSISADGLSLYFSSDRPGGSGSTDIWVTTRATVSDLWGPPVNLGATVNSPNVDWTPFISADNLSLYFSSDRPGGLSNPNYFWGDLWVTTRTMPSDPWGPPIHLKPPVNSGQRELCPYVSPDGLLLLFCGFADTGPSSQDLWQLTRATKDSPWIGPTCLASPINMRPEVATLSPYLSFDGLYLFFSSNRPGGPFEPLDLWVTTRASTSSNWSVPKNLGQAINTSEYSEYGPSIPADGSTLYFSSDRPGGVGEVGSDDLWQASITPVVDFNRDGKVDLHDLLTLIRYWGQNEPSVDIAPPLGDGKIDEKDLEVLMSSWAQTVEVPDPDSVVRRKSDLAAYWRLDETEGTLAYDSVGDQDGTLHGSPAWQPTGGKVEGALQFDGVDDYVSTGLVWDPPGSPFAVFARVKGGAPGQVILSQEGGADWLSTDPTAGWLTTDLKSAGRFARSLKSQVVITDGNWHRVGLSWDGSTRVLYVDDDEVARDSQAAIAGANTGMHIGAGAKLAPGAFWSGLIDDVCIYDRAVKP